MAALVSTGIGVIGVGGVLALSGASALWGGMLGGYLGTAVGGVGWDEHQEFGYVALEPGEVLVVVCSHGQPVLTLAPAARQRRSTHLQDRHDRLIDPAGSVRSTRNERR